MILPWPVSELVFLSKKKKKKLETARALWNLEKKKIKKNGCPTERPVRRGWSRSPAALAMGTAGVCSEAPVEQSERPWVAVRLSVPRRVSGC